MRAPPLSISQLATTFLGFLSQAIHQTVYLSLFYFILEVYLNQDRRLSAIKHLDRNILLREYLQSKYVISEIGRAHV